RARSHESGDLVAERLAAARRHEHDRVAPADDLLDDLRLLAAELGVAEDAMQHVEWSGGGHEPTVPGGPDADRRGRRSWGGDRDLPAVTGCPPARLVCPPFGVVARGLLNRYLRLKVTGYLGGIR